MRYPNLSSEPKLSIDIETKDPGLKDLGPSNYRADKGYILGVAIGTDRHQEYYNYSQEHDRQYIKDVMALPNTKLGHSLIYDVDWLESEGIKVNGNLYDIMIAEALVDNTKDSYNLESIAEDYLGEQKDTSQVEQALAVLSIKPTKKRPIQDYLWLLSHDIVRDYALQDIRIPLKVFNKQHKTMENLGLLDLFDMESKLIRVLLYMRKIGVPYSTSLSQEASNDMQAILVESNRLLKNNYGDPNPNSGKEIAYHFYKLGIDHPYTDSGNPSITREFLESLVEEQGLEHYSVADFLPLLILNARRLGKSERDYIAGIREKYLCEDSETIRCTFHQTRDADNFGTVSGRFSCSKPNLQQISSKERDTFIGGHCRRAFTPYPNHKWVKVDYSQIEYRILAHYAKGAGAREVRERYNNDPLTDYHSYIVDLTGLKRPIAKNLNFGLAFGMGIKKLMRLYGWDEYKARDILSIYHGEAPFVKATMKDVRDVAVSRGYVKTILGRRAILSDERKAYIMFNRVIQGSGADLMKKAMIDIFESGLLDEKAHMHLTVHDELDFSILNDNSLVGIVKEIKHIMESALTLRVPIIAEASIGDNWGDVEKMELVA